MKLERGEEPSGELERFLKANEERIADLHIRLERHGKQKDFEGYVLRTALRIEKDIHKGIVDWNVDTNEYLKIYRVGFVYRRTMGIRLPVVNDEMIIEGISDASGTRERFEEHSAEDLLRYLYF